MSHFYIASFQSAHEIYGGVTVVGFVIEAESFSEFMAELSEKAELMGGEESRLLTVRRQGRLC